MYLNVLKEKDIILDGKLDHNIKTINGFLIGYESNAEIHHSLFY
jgi:hypothetical protein